LAEWDSNPGSLPSFCSLPSNIHTCSTAESSWGVWVPLRFCSRAQHMKVTATNQFHGQRSHKLYASGGTEPSTSRQCGSCLSLGLRITPVPLYFFAVLEIELRAPQMLGECSTTESHPQTHNSLLIAVLSGHFQRWRLWFSMCVG
jgi:hypothetical protein